MRQPVGTLLRRAAQSARAIRESWASEAFDRAQAVRRAVWPNLVYPCGYDAVGMCCACGYLGFIRIYIGPRLRDKSVCCCCEGVPYPAQQRIAAQPAKSVTRLRKADAA
jgi:hypothetical protein